jgi:signal transduction histidine kinase
VFDKEDVTVLQILGNQICVAIENARLFQETKHRYDAMIALHETSLDMIAELDTPRLLQALLRRGSQLLDAQAGSFYLYDAEKKSIRNIANYNTEHALTGVAVRPGQGAIGQVVLTGKPLIIDDYEKWEGRAEIFSGGSLRRIISVPLKWQGRVIGGLNVSNQFEKRPFDQSDLWLLSLFADLASLAIKNAELHTQVMDSSQMLELKVSQRTEELTEARDEIALKAEQLRSLLDKTIEIQEKERARIARDMHDGVIQMISAARFELQAAEVLTSSEMVTTAKEKFETTYKILEEMEREIRRDIYDLHPPILDAVGVAPALQKYLRNFQELSGINCKMQVNGVPYRLPRATEIAIFRIAQEALQNVAVHSNAEAVSITMDYEPTMLGISVQDNGLGFDYEEWINGHRGNHLGLGGMQERIENIGGRIKVSSEIGQGTQVLLQLPIVQDEDTP